MVKREGLSKSESPSEGECREDMTERERMEKAMRASEEKHRTLFETMAQGVVYQDSNGRIVSANPAAERILGLTLDQMQGRTSMHPRWKAIHEDGSDFPGETHPSMVALKTGKEAIEKSNSQFFNLALIDIRLPDMEGTQLLTAMKETTPKMIKLIITGYPALANATEAINKGADGYIVKPVNLNTLLETVKEHLKKQQEATKYSEEKVKEFIETRAEEHESLASEERKQKK